MARRKRTAAATRRRMQAVDDAGVPEASTTKMRPLLAPAASRKIETIPSRETLTHTMALVTGAPNSLTARLGAAAASAAAAWHSAGKISAQVLQANDAALDPWTARRRMRESQQRLHGAAKLAPGVWLSCQRRKGLQGSDR